MNYCVLCEMLSSVWNVEFCMKYCVLCEMLSSVWNVELCVKCWVVCEMLSSVWNVEFCVKCWVMCEMLSSVWNVELCIFSLDWQNCPVYPALHVQLPLTASHTPPFSHAHCWEQFCPNFNVGHGREQLSPCQPGSHKHPSEIYKTSQTN